MDFLKLSNIFFDLIKEASGYHHLIKKIKNSLFNDVDLFCSICNKKFSSIDEITIEHIIPKSKGGKNNLENHTFSCQSCNQNRSSSDLEAYRKYVKTNKSSDPPVDSVEFQKSNRKLLGQVNFLNNNLKNLLEQDYDDVISIMENFTLTNQQKYETLKRKYNLKNWQVKWIIEQGLDLKKIIRKSKILKNQYDNDDNLLHPEIHL